MYIVYIYKRVIFTTVYAIAALESHLGMYTYMYGVKYQTSTARYDRTRSLSDCFKSVFTTDT